MAGSTTKQVIVERFEKEPLNGYVNPISFLQPEGIELLTVQGHISTLPYTEVKTVSFVRDLEAAAGTPPTPARRLFLTRPKMEGLWVRLWFRDEDMMEGVMPNNLMPLEPYGFTVIPPDSYSHRQRVFIPRAALRSAAVLGVVGSPLTRRKEKAAPKEQIRLFEE